MEMGKSEKRRHRKYDSQFKKEALAQIDNGQTVSSVARALGISEALLYQWRKRRESTTNGNGTSDQHNELLKQIKQLEMERDILKKALAILGRLN